MVSMEPLKKKYEDVLQIYRTNDISATNLAVKELLKEAREKNDTYYYAVGLNFLGALQTALGNDSRAIDYYFETMLYAEKNHEEEVLVLVYNNIAVRYMDTDAYDQALLYLKKAEELSKKLAKRELINRPAFEARVLIMSVNFAISYSYRNQYEMSEKYLHQISLKENEHNDDLDFTISFIQCRNQYFLGKLDEIKAIIEILMNQVKHLESLYNYEVNITDLFEFLIHLNEYEKCEELMSRVEEFAALQDNSDCRLLGAKMRYGFAKQQNNQEEMGKWAIALSELFAQKESQSKQERRDSMTFRMEMKLLDAKRNEEEAHLQELIQSLVSLEYDYIADIDLESQEFHFYPSKKNNKIYEDYDSLKYDLIHDAIQKEKLDIALSLDSILKELHHHEQVTLQITKETGTVKKVVVHYADTSNKRFLLAVNDITKIIEKEKAQKERLHEALLEAEKANRAKTEFLSSMSHEIRTPLNAVIGYNKMAQQSIHHLDLMQSYQEKSNIAAEHLLSVINDVLDISAISSGHFKLEHSVFDIRKIMEEITAIFYEQSKEKKIHFDVVVEEYPQANLIGDALRVKQILINLISNALKFTSTGGSICLSLKILKKSLNHVLISFEVQDDGVGMSLGFLNRIFTPFEQDASISRKYGGTGLGLSICAKLCEMMEGTIDVESQEGQGTTFFVRLPFELADPKKEIECKKQSDNCPPFNLEGLKVLIVEDNEMNMEIATHLLKHVGIEVVCAQSGQEGIQKFHEVKDLDIILMDIQMPEMDGYEAVKRIRSSNQKNALTIPIFALTANAYAQDVHKAIECGMNGHIAKPIQVQELYHTLENVIIEKREVVKSR